MSFPEFPGAHSRDELLTRVRRQGARRRALRWGALGASVVAAAVVGSALALTSGDSPRPTNVAASNSNTSTTVVTTIPAVEAPTTTAPVPVPTTHLVSPKPPATTAPSTTTTTAPPVCGTGDFASTVTTDRSTYPQRATVTIVLTAQNVSGHPCATAPPDWLEAHHRSASVQTASGSQVWEDRRPSTLELAAPTYVVPPGGTISLSTQWDENTCASPTYNPQTDSNGCTGPAAAPGQYKAFDGWNAYKPLGSTWVNTVSSPAFQVQ